MHVLMVSPGWRSPNKSWTKSSKLFTIHHRFQQNAAQPDLCLWFSTCKARRLLRHGHMQSSQHGGRLERRTRRSLGLQDPRWGELRESIGQKIRCGDPIGALQPQIVKHGVVIDTTPTLKTVIQNLYNKVTFSNQKFILILFNTNGATPALQIMADLVVEGKLEYWSTLLSCWKM